MEERVEKNVFDDLALEMEEVIKNHLNSIEVLWVMNGNVSKIGLKVIRNKNLVIFLIGSKEDFNNDIDSYLPAFAVFSIQSKDETTILNRVETRLYKLGYSSFTTIQQLFPDLIEKREKLGLETIDTDRVTFFQFKAIDDLIDLFQLIEHSSIQFGDYS